MALRRITLLVNPNSRCVSKTAIEETASFLAGQIDTSLIWTSEPSDASFQASNHGSDPDTLVVACGGDGTFFHVLNGLPPNGVIGLLPIGTANVIARELGIPLSLREAAKTLLTGAVRTFDTGRFNDKRFFMVAGCEFDAYVAASVRQPLKKLLGQFAYHLEAIRCYAAYEPPTIRVEIDSKESVKAAFVLVANLRRYGGGLFFAQDARPDDGLLDLVAFRRLSFHYLLKAFWNAYTRHGVSLDVAHRCRGQNFILRSSKAVMVQLDGEVLEPFKEAIIKVEPSSLRMVVP